MHDPWSGSISLGRWHGVTIRVHMFFILFAVFALLFSGIGAGSEQPTWVGGATVGILFFAVLLHEIGHTVVARRLGGPPTDIVLGPLGGLVPVRVPYEPQAEIVALMAGPLVNLGTCLFAAVMLVFGHQLDLVELMNPFAPRGLTLGEIDVVVLKLMFWINWLLVLANMIPTFPFDGGRALRCLLDLIWPDLERRQSSQLLVRIGRLAALALGVAAWFASDDVSSTAVPIWFALAILSVFVFFSAGREQHLEAQRDLANEDKFFGYDFSEGYTSLERSVESRTKVTPPRTSILSRWLERRRDQRRQRQSALEASEERQADELLVKVHEQGSASLSRAERALLERVSKRLREKNSASAK
jgi:Zn-dependent protease